MEIHSRFRVRCCLMLNVEYKVVKRAKIVINVINFESISEGTIPLMSKTIVRPSVNRSINQSSKRIVALIHVLFLTASNAFPKSSRAKVSVTIPRTSTFRVSKYCMARGKHHIWENELQSCQRKCIKSHHCVSSSLPKDIDLIREDTGRGDLD